MLRYSDMPVFAGPLADPQNPTFCLRCEHEIYYECEACKTLLGTELPADEHVCPHCGGDAISGPRCICTNCDCGED
jgi:hypothetical protein